MEEIVVNCCEYSTDSLQVVVNNNRVDKDVKFTINGRNGEYSVFITKDDVKNIISYIENNLK